MSQPDAQIFIHQNFPDPTVASGSRALKFQSSSDSSTTGSMSSSVPNPSRRGTTTVSRNLPISLEGLKANKDIARKQSYIHHHAKALIIQRMQALEQLLDSMSRYGRALNRPRSKPLHRGRDKGEVEKQRVRVLQRFTGLEEQVWEIMKERAMITGTLADLSAEMKLENREHTEWVLMPSMVWNLARLG